jgi:cold shock CspA family protein
MGRVTGQLAHWNYERGFGFLRVAGEKRHTFLHNKRLRPEHRGLIELGNLFSFVPLHTERGIEALEPLLIEQYSEAA